MYKVSQLLIALLFRSLIQRTPLHIAVGECQEKTVKSLVDRKADINIQDNDGVRRL